MERYGLGAGFESFERVARLPGDPITVRFWEGRIANSVTALRPLSGGRNTIEMASHPQFSYEFFPPRTPVMEHRLWRAMGQLERLDPLFYSMTYGALGSAQAISVQTAMSMQRESPVPVAAHLTAADATRDTVEKVSEELYAGGIRSIVALRGDASSGDGHYAFASALELVQALRERWDDIDLMVAAYPEVHLGENARRVWGTSRENLMRVLAEP